MADHDLATEQSEGIPDPDPETLAPEDLAEIEEPDPNPEPITYSGSDFDVEGLVRRLNRGDIIIPTFGHSQQEIETAPFQRGSVWTRTQMDRFIESLLLGYPIPGIFLVQQADRRYLVLDGQQRLNTLEAFYKGLHGGHEFALTKVGDRFNGLTYSSLAEEERRILDDTFIQATIVKTDGTPDSLDAIYQIFERLNAGGTQLTPHEIRVALYAGPFIEFLSDLNSNEDWRSLYGPPSPRLRDQELLLRILALYVSPGTYRRPLKKYLNDFVAAHRQLQNFSVSTIQARFEQSVALLGAERGPGRDALRSGSNQVNAALAEAILVGLFRRLDSGSPPDPSSVKDATEKMLEDESLVTAISRATADDDAVRTRLGIATSMLGSS